QTQTKKQVTLSLRNHPVPPCPWRPRGEPHAEPTGVGGDESRRAYRRRCPTRRTKDRDIARAVSRGLSSRRERLAPTRPQPRPAAAVYPATQRHERLRRRRRRRRPVVPLLCAAVPLCRCAARTVCDGAAPPSRGCSV